jgi:Predicted pPIWI-associating nuclease
LQKSLVEDLHLDLPKFALPPDILGEARIQAMLRDALAQNRMVSDVASRITEPLWSASASITALMQSLRPGREFVDHLSTVNLAWKPLVLPDMLRLANIPPLGLGAHLASISRLTETSRMLAGMLPTDRIGRAFSLPPELRAGLVTGFKALTGAYGDFYKSFGPSGDELLALPPAATSRPATEYFNAVDLLETTTGEEVDQEAEGEVGLVRAQIAAETADALSASLTGRFPDLITLIQGARAAFTSRQADYERHFITSLRELFNHVLHRLAPDDDVRKFSTDAKDFPDNKPTRNVRLRYICRAVNSGRFVKFVEKDVAAAVALVEILNGGTHEVTCSYTEIQCRALMARAEGLVRFLLEIAAVE